MTFYPKSHQAPGVSVVYSLEAMGKIERMGLSSEEHSTLLALASGMDFFNNSSTAHNELAQQHGILPIDFARSVKKLITIGAVRKGPQIRGRISYILNPYVVRKIDPGNQISEAPGVWEPFRD